MSDNNGLGANGDDLFSSHGQERVYDLPRRLASLEESRHQDRARLNLFDERLRLVEERVWSARDQSVLLSQRVDRLERAQPDAQAGFGRRRLVTTALIAAVMVGGVFVVSVLAPAIANRHSEWTTQQSLLSSRLSLDDMPHAAALPARTSPPMPAVVPFETTNLPPGFDGPILSATDLEIEKGLIRLIVVCRTADTSAGAIFHARAKDYFNVDPCAFLTGHDPEPAKPAVATGAASLSPPVGSTEGVAVPAILPPSLQPLPR